MWAIANALAIAFSPISPLRQETLIGNHNTHSNVARRCTQKKSVGSRPPHDVIQAGVHIAPDTLLEVLGGEEALDGELVGGGLSERKRPHPEEAAHTGNDLARAGECPADSGRRWK